MILGHHILSIVIGAVAGSITGTLVAIFASSHTAAFWTAICFAGFVAAGLGARGTQRDTDDNTTVIKPLAAATGFLCGVILIALLGNFYLIPTKYEISASSNTFPTLLPFGQ